MGFPNSGGNVGSGWQQRLVIRPFDVISTDQLGVPGHSNCGAVVLLQFGSGRGNQGMAVVVTGDAVEVAWGNGFH